MGTWPSTLTITRDGFTETPPDNVIRSSMGIGPDKVRKRTSANTRPLGMSLFLNDTELATLDQFYLDNAAFQFDFIHPRTGTVEQARFVEPPSYNLEQQNYRVSVSLEILP